MAPQPPKLKIRISTPGKVILHGEHSVVYGKLAVAATLGLRTKLEFKECDNQDGKIRINFDSVHLAHIYETKDFESLLNIPLPLTKTPTNYGIASLDVIDHSLALETVKTFIKVKGGSFPLDEKQNTALISFFYLYWSILSTLDYTVPAFKLQVTSDLTIGAGTGSSASFAVTISAFLLQLIRMKKLQTKSLYKKYKIINTSLASFDDEELRMISKWAYESERIVHGTPSGVDNTVCTFGNLVEFRRNHTPKLIKLSMKFRLILINTNVSRNTKLLVEVAAKRRENYKFLIDGVLEGMEQISVKAIACIKKINEGCENEFELMEQYDSLQELTDMNQHFLAALGVSHPKLDEICLILHKNGLNGKLTGAGGGGYAICIIPPYLDKDILEKVLNELNNNGLSAVLTDLGGCGVTIDAV